MTAPISKQLSNFLHLPNCAMAVSHPAGSCFDVLVWSADSTKCVAFFFARGVGRSSSSMTPRRGCRTTPSESGSTKCGGRWTGWTRPSCAWTKTSCSSTPSSGWYLCHKCLLACSLALILRTARLAYCFFFLSVWTGRCGRVSA